VTAEQALDVLEGIMGTVIEPRATLVDETASFPRDAVEALGKSGLLGLISSPEVGGMGLGPSAASAVIERIAKACGSTAMVVTMHLCATAAIEAHGDTATRTAIAGGSHLSADGGGLDIALGAVLPWFQLLNASMSLGTMEAATTKATEHATSARFEHLGQSLAAQPETRARLARMRFVTDQTRTFVADTAAAMETGREDAMLRVLESKAIAAENAISVTDLAMRVGGGAAFRKDIGIERNFRDARAASVMAPTTDALSDFVGRIMCGMPLFGEVS
jgi:alkylation response protein AidB-like acyl-CoA dehydrogenase